MSFVKGTARGGSREIPNRTDFNPRSPSKRESEKKPNQNGGA